MNQNILQVRDERQKRIIYLLILVPFLFFVFEVILPLGATAYYSLTKWRGVGKPEWAGLTNYILLFKSPDFWKVTGNTLILALVCTLGQVGAALILTLVMTGDRLRFREFHQAIIFFPVVMAPLVVGYVWRFVFSSEYGILNMLLRLAGREEWIRLWLDDTRIVLFSAAVPVIWQYVGLYMIILLGNASTISKEVYESAALDGAGGFASAIHITLPLLRPGITLCLILSAVGTMKIYDHLVALTKGGPGRATESLAMYAYEYTFRFGNFGMGSAVAVTIPVLALILMGAIRLGAKIIGRGEEE